MLNLMAIQNSKQIYLQIKMVIYTRSLDCVEIQKLFTKQWKKAKKREFNWLNVHKSLINSIMWRRLIL